MDLCKKNFIIIHREPIFCSAFRCRLNQSVKFNHDKQMKFLKKNNYFLKKLHIQASVSQMLTNNVKNFQVNNVNFSHKLKNKHCYLAGQRMVACTLHYCP